MSRLWSRTIAAVTAGMLAGWATGVAAQESATEFTGRWTVESQLLSARTSEVSAEAARATAFISLARAMGGGWRAPQEIDAAIATGPPQP